MIKLNFISILTMALIVISNCSNKEKQNSESDKPIVEDTVIKNIDSSEIKETPAQLSSDSEVVYETNNNDVQQSTTTYEDIIELTTTPNLAITLPKLNELTNNKIEESLKNYSSEEINKWALKNIFNIETFDASEYDYKIIEITNLFTIYYLFFEKKNENFIYKSYYEVYSKRGTKPTITEINNKFGIIVYEFGGGGSGTSQEISNILIETKDSVKNVFSYPNDGYVVGWGQPFNRNFSSSINMEKLKEGLIELNYSVSYSIPESEETEDEITAISKEYIFNAKINENDSIDILETSQISLSDILKVYTHGIGYFKDFYSKELEELKSSENHIISSWAAMMQQYEVSENEDEE